MIILYYIIYVYFDIIILYNILAYIQRNGDVLLEINEPFCDIDL